MTGFWTKCFNSNNWRNESALERGEVARFTQLIMAEKIFPRIAGLFFGNGNQGIRADFGETTLLVDALGGRMSVAIEKGSTRLSFVTAEERPFGLFHNPGLTSCVGTPGKFYLMLNQVEQGLKRAQRRGNTPQVVKEYSGFVKMFEAFI